MDFPDGSFGAHSELRRIYKELNSSDPLIRAGVEPNAVVSQILINHAMSVREGVVTGSSLPEPEKVVLLAEIRRVAVEAVRFAEGGRICSERCW